MSPVLLVDEEEGTLLFSLTAMTLFCESPLSCCPPTQTLRGSGGESCGVSRIPQTYKTNKPLLLLPLTLLLAKLCVVYNTPTCLPLAIGAAQMGRVLLHALLPSVCSLRLFRRTAPTPHLISHLPLVPVPVVVRTLRVASHHAATHTSRKGVLTHSQRLLRLRLLGHIPANRLDVRRQRVRLLLGVPRALMQLP